MARLPYTDFKDKAFTAAGKPTINVMKMLGHSSSTIEHWAAIGAAQFAHFSLPKKLRELVILFTTAKFNSAYEFRHHIPLSSRFGVTDAQRDEFIKAGKTKEKWFSRQRYENGNGFAPKELLLLRFLEQIIDDGEVGEELWAETRETFSDREIVEILSMQVRLAHRQIYVGKPC
jgi:alkylhydroperoxidase family enzyme